MTAVFASAERVEALIEESGAEGVEVAADNGTHRVVSGLVEGVEALEGWCIEGRGAMWTIGDESCVSQ